MAVKKVDPMDNLITPIEQEAPVNVEAEHLKQMFDMIYSTDNIEVKTDLTPPQILAITKLSIYGTTFGIDIANQIAHKFMELSVSKNRLGRKEFTEISKATQSPSIELGTPTIQEKLLGGSRR